MDVKILGIDKYPSESFLDVLLTVQYEYVGEGACLIAYVDNAPLKKVNYLNDALSQLYRRKMVAVSLENNL